VLRAGFFEALLKVLFDEVEACGGVGGDCPKSGVTDSA
jgi:hypothetical protein